MPDPVTFAPGCVSFACGVACLLSALAILSAEPWRVRLPAAGLLASAVLGTAGALLLWHLGLQAGALAAAGAALMCAGAWAYQRRMADGGDDHGGGGWTDQPDGPDGGGIEIDWARFEREFAAYAREQARPLAGVR